MAKIELEDRAKAELQDKISQYFKAEFDLEMGGLEAQMLLDFLEREIGVSYYNQALNDGRRLIEKRIEIIGESLIELEKFSP